MFLSLLLLASSVTSWLPMRWPWPDPASLKLIRDTPINCILLEPKAWNSALLSAAKDAGIATLGVVRSDTAADIAKAAKLPLTGIVLEGDGFPAGLPIPPSLTVIRLPSRAHLRFDTADPVIGTHQGVWPGIHADDKAEAAPSGAPWIHTNSGFLRFSRALTQKPVWIAHLPPSNQVITGLQYRQAIADAALAGAQWVLAFDPDFAAKLTPASKDWQEIVQLLQFLKANDLSQSRPRAQLALLQDRNSGAFYSGGILDMLAVKHTPVLPVPANSLTAERLQGAKMAVNVTPAALAAEQKQALEQFRSRGGSVLSGPPSWQFPTLTADKITLTAEETKFLDEAWRELNQMTGRRNLGARLFNVSSMLSSLTGQDNKAILTLTNFSAYPAENITVHLLGKFKKAELRQPGKPPAALEVFDTDEGIGLEIPAINVYATVIMEQ